MEERTQEVVKAVSEFLTDMKFRYSYDEKDGNIRYVLPLVCKTVLFCSGIVDFKEDRYLSLAIFPLKGDPEDSTLMGRLSEFITRANYGIMFGNFELDMNDGEIRYKAYVPCYGDVPSRETIESSVFSSAATISRYAEGLVDVLTRGADPKDACVE